MQRRRTVNEFIPDESKEYVCPVHGDIGVTTLVSTMEGNEAVLCLRCYVEKLIEIGVSKVKEKNT
jgi:hypothetical protein